MWKTTQLKIQNIIGKPVPIQEHFYIAKLCYSVIKLFFFSENNVTSVNGKPKTKQPENGDNLYLWQTNTHITNSENVIILMSIFNSVRMYVSGWTKLKEAPC